MSDVDLSFKFPEMRPLSGPPILWTINGCGLAVYGSRDFDAETGTYIKTHFITLLYLPIFGLKGIRVADASPGYYLVGREPLSALVKFWNCLVLVGLCGFGGVLAWESHVKSPNYVAARRLEAADRLAGSGKTEQAARAYAEVATGPSDKASTAASRFKSMVDGTIEKGTLTEAADVLRSAVMVARQGRWPAPKPSLVSRGLQLIAAKSDADLKGALSVLEAVEPVADDPKELIASRLGLLQKLVAREPHNPELASRLAVLYEERGETGKCEPILEPVRNQLGLTEGARILGRIDAGKGNIEKAHALLLPYTEGRLGQLHQAEERMNAAYRQAQERILSQLSQGKNTDFDYQKYKTAVKVDQTRMIQEYLEPRLKGDAGIAAAQDQLLKEAKVVPVALDLGMVLLQRAQGMTDPASRKAELEKAEKMFLAVRGIAGESDSYRLNLGQVYYWLGKHAEGRKLFDELLASRQRSYEIVKVVGRLLHEVGSETEARALVEEAYNKETDSSRKQELAIDRAILHADLDDEILWLKRSNTSMTNVEALLASSLGQKALREGDDAEAAKQFRRSLALHDKETENKGTLNNSAIVCFQLYRITGEREVYDKGLAKIERAAALDPSNSVLVGNAAHTLEEAACFGLIGSRLDLRVLKAAAGLHWLVFLYSDQAGRDALVKQARDDAGLARALSFYQKAQLLAPRRPTTYASMERIYRFLEDADQLRNLQKRLGAVQLDQGDEIAVSRDFFAGKRDEKTREEQASALKGIESSVAAARSRGKDATLAAALSSFVQARMSATAFSEAEPADPRELLALAEEAHKASPSASTRSLRIHVLLHGARLALAKDDPDFAAIVKKARRSVDSSRIIAWAAMAKGPLRDKVLGRPEVRRALDLERESIAALPDSVGPWALILFQAADDPDFARLRDAAIRNEVDRLDRELDLTLRPMSAGAAMDAYWMKRLEGKESEGKAILEEFARRGVPLPPEPTEAP